MSNHSSTPRGRGKKWTTILSSNLNPTTSYDSRSTRSKGRETSHGAFVTAKTRPEDEQLRTQLRSREDEPLNEAEKRADRHQNANDLARPIPNTISPLSRKTVKKTRPSRDQSSLEHSLDCSQGDYSSDLGLEHLVANHRNETENDTTAP